jgi:hypothetical protein
MNDVSMAIANAPVFRAQCARSRMTHEPTLDD